MSIPASTRRSGPFMAVAGQTDFTFTWRVLDSADLKVTRLRGNVATVLAYGTGFILLAGSLDNPSGGTVRLTAASLANDQIVIDGARAAERAADFSALRAIGALDLNADSDAQQIQIQELRRDADAALRKNPFTGAYDAGGAKASGLAPATQMGDAVVFEQLLAINDPAAASAASASAIAAAASASAALGTYLQTQTLAAETLADTEAVYQDTQTLSAATLATADAARAGAEAAEDAVQGVVGAVTLIANSVTAGSNLYANEATGRAAVADGAIFRAIGATSNNAIDIWQRVNSSSSTLLRTLHSSVVTDRVADQTLGTAAVVASGLVTAATTYVIPQPAAINGRIATIECAVAVAQTVEVMVVTLSGSNFTKVSGKTVSLAAGVNTVPIDLPITAGQYVAWKWSTGGYYQSGMGGGVVVWYTNSDITTNTPRVVSSGLDLEFKATLQGTVLGDLTTTAALAQAMDATLGGLQTIGQTVEGGSASVTGTGVVYYLSTPAARTGTIKRARIYTNATAGEIVVASLTAGGLLQIVSRTPIETLTNTINEFAPGIPVQAGQYVGYAPTGGGLRFRNVANSPAVWYHSGGVPAIGATVARTITTGIDVEMQFVLGSGVAADAYMLQQAGDRQGLRLLSETVPPGDATALLEAARAAHPHPYVPLGTTFRVTNLNQHGNGLWGPGTVLLNGKKFYLPPEPQRGNLYYQLRAALGGEIQDGSPLIVLGDSIQWGAYAFKIADTWFNQLTAFANIEGSPNDEPVFTAFGPWLEPPQNQVHGLTYTGTISTGTRGPLAQSLILTPGASLNFTGAYADVSVTYIQEPGAGSLAFQYNGGAAFKSVNANGTLQEDKSSFPSPTGQTASGNFTITASGGPVEITSLIRLGAKAPGSLPRLYTMRAAYPAYRSALFTAARLQSMMRVAAFAGGTRPAVILGVGTNDRYVIGETAAGVKQNTKNLIARLRAAGVTRMAGMLPLRWDPTVWDVPPFDVAMPYEPVVAGVADAYREEGIPVFPVASYDFLGAGHMYDGLHPSTDGNLQGMAPILIDAIARQPW